MNTLTPNTQEITSAVKPFIDTITEDQRDAVLNVLAVTLGRNFPSDVIANNSEIFEILQINADVLASVANATNSAKNAVENPTGNKSVATAETGDFTSDLELFALYSKISSESVMSEKSEANKVEKAIVNSGNQSLLFAALKSPFAEEYFYKFAKKLAEIGGAKYLYRAFSSMPKKTNASRLMARALAEAGDASVIYEAITNADIEDGIKESIILAHGLAMTKAYELMEKVYVNYDDNIEEGLILCNAIASSGDVDFIQKIIGDSTGTEELKILACGLQAASVYTQIKKALL